MFNLSASFMLLLVSALTSAAPQNELEPPTPTPTHTYEDCGGFRPTPKPCPEGFVCVDDPFRGGGCGMACDIPGLCVKPVFCGGFAGLECEDGKQCVDDPRDQCDPKNGGADCGGICV